MSTKCLIAMLESAIQARHGNVRQSQFRNKSMDHFGRHPAFDQNPEGTQVTLMNGFWRFLLTPIDGSVEVRAWLDECDNVDEWLNSCVNNWLDDAIKLGALD